MDREVKKRPVEKVIFKPFHERPDSPLIDWVYGLQNSRDKLKDMGVLVSELVYAYNQYMEATNGTVDSHKKGMDVIASVAKLKELWEKDKHE